MENRRLKIEVERTVKRLKDGKAVGGDGIQEKFGNMEGKG